MSIVSTLALMATAVVAKIRRPDDHLQTQIDDLKRERDEWRAMAESWRARAYQRAEIAREQQRPAGPDFRPPEVVEAHAQMMQAQAQLLHAQVNNQRLAQQAQQCVADSGHNHQMLNMMNQIDDFIDGSFCNCVPGRHQILTKR